MNLHAAMSTVTVKGQVVIPAKLRHKVGLKKGTRVYMEEKDGDIIIHPATPEFYDRVRGIFKDGPSLTQALLKERARDREREERKIQYWMKKR